VQPPSADSTQKNADSTIECAVSIL
jgi:hypothetical protein